MNLKLFFYIFFFSTFILTHDARASKNCTQCHESPPVNFSSDNEFNPGAHQVHKEIDCNECHSTSGESGHNDGVITINQEIGYELGTKVSWPGHGGGSCGGTSGGMLPIGCHEGFKQNECYWLPGKACKKVEKKL